MLLFLMISWITAWKKDLHHPLNKKTQRFSQSPPSGFWLLRLPHGKRLCHSLYGEKLGKWSPKKSRWELPPFLGAPDGASRCLTRSHHSFGFLLQLQLAQHGWCGSSLAQKQHQCVARHFGWWISDGWTREKSESLFFLKVKFIVSHDKKHMI